MRRDKIAILEAAYAPAASRKEWLAGVLDGVQPHIDQGRGVLAFFFTIRPPATLEMEGDTAIDRGMQPGDMHILARAHATFTGNVDVARRTFLGDAGLKSSSSTMPREWTDFCAREGLDARRNDSLTVVATDPSRRGCVFMAVSSKVERPDRRVASTWARIAAHVAAGRRLQAIFGGSGASGVGSGGEAVLGADGRVAHAVGAARDADARSSLRAAARAIDKARTRRMRSDAEQALELWKGLVAGRWSIVDRFDTDGRRFFVAYKNVSATSSPRALTARERQVIAYAAMGHSNKLVAYELGLSIGAVSAYLASGLQKLGLRSRVELVSFGVR